MTETPHQYTFFKKCQKKCQKSKVGVLDKVLFYMWFTEKKYVVGDGVEMSYTVLTLANLYSYNSMTYLNDLNIAYHFLLTQVKTK